MAVLLLLLLAGCQGQAEDAAPTILADRPLAPVLAVAAVAGEDGTRLAVSLQGEGLRWLTADGTQAGPAATAEPERLLAVDLDGDQRDELILGSRRAIEAWSPTNALLWRYETGNTPLLGLAAADLTGNGTPTILAAGMPPLGLTAIAADGALAWRDAGVRSALDVTAVAPAAGEGLAWAVLDTHLVARYDGIGQQVGTLRPTVGQDRLALAPTAVARLGEQTLITGRQVGEQANPNFWVLYRDDGTPTASGPLPGLLGQDRLSLAVGAFRRTDEVLAAIADGAGAIHFIGATGEAVAELKLERPILCLTARREGELDRLLVGTPTGLVTVGW